MSHSSRPPVVRYAFPIAAACTALGIGKTSLYKLIAAGELRAIKIAGRTLVPKSEIERLTTILPSDRVT